MQTIQTVFDTLIEKVQTSPGSLFTKDDVCSILSDFEKQVAAVQSTENPTLTYSEFDAIKKLISEQYQETIDNTGSDYLIDFDSVELSIGYNNRIEVDSIDLNKDAIFAKLEYVLDTVFNQYQKN